MSNTPGKIPYEPARLVDRKNDLSKRWYIEFYAWNGQAEKLERKLKYLPSNLKTAKERKNWASNHIKVINELLATGYHIQPKPGQADLPAPAPIPGRKKYLEAIKFAVDLKVAAGRQRTKQAYNSFYNVFSHFAQDRFNDKFIDELTIKDVYQFLDYIQFQRKVGNTTRNNYLQYLSALLTELVKREILLKNPCPTIDELPEDVGKNIAYSESEQALIDQYLLTNDPQLFYFTKFIYYGFLRPNELVQLEIKYIDLKNKKIIIPAHISKNRKQQTITIVKPLLSIIKQMKLDSYKNDYLLFAKNLLPGSKKIYPTRVSERYRKVLDELQIKSRLLTLYSWKHTGVVNAYRVGVDIKTLQAQLRHHSLEMTDIYLKSLGLSENKELEEKSW